MDPPVHISKGCHWRLRLYESGKSRFPILSVKRQPASPPIRRKDGRPWFIHGVGFDITKLKLAQEKLEHDAFHDSLTSLPNRALFLDRLERVVARAKRHKDYKFAVLFIDMDRFKIVNDSLGHQAGDDLIIQASQRILNSLRREDVISRPMLALNPEWNTTDDTLARLGGEVRSF